MTYKEQHVDLTDKKIFDDHGDEICKICPWNNESQPSEEICEAYHCGEAMKLFLEEEVEFMQSKLKEIKERAEKATYRSWEYKVDNINDENICGNIRSTRTDECDIGFDDCDIVYPTSGALTNEDVVFVAHARQDITYLLKTLQQVQDKLNRTEKEWELQVLKRITYCENEPNKSIIKINQDLKVELQQSRAREKVYRETLKNLYL